MCVCVWGGGAYEHHIEVVSYLEASRRSTMRFVDIHSHELPPASSVFMEHLWHRDST